MARPSLRFCLSRIAARNALISTELNAELMSKPVASGNLALMAFSTSA
jgi:hypothetical protein